MRQQNNVGVLQTFTRVLVPAERRFLRSRANRSRPCGGERKAKQTRRHSGRLPLLNAPLNGKGEWKETPGPGFGRVALYDGKENPRKMSASVQGGFAGSLQHGHRSAIILL